MAEEQPSYFWGNAPPGSPLSYEALQTRRKIAEQLMSRRSPFPKTLGEGLTYFGEKASDAFTQRDLERQDALYQAQRGAAAGEQGQVARGNVPVRQTPATPPARPYNMTEAMPDDTGEQSPFIAASEPAQTQEPISPAVATAALTDQVPLPPPRPARDRSRQLAEMQANPAVMQRLMETTAGELDPGYSRKEGQIQFQTAMDRAAARDIPVSQALETYTGRGSRGYYPPEVVPRGARALQDPERLAAFQRDIADPVLRGADPGREQFGFTPTGNASLGVAQRGVESGRYNRYGKLPGRGETFVQQETPQQLALLDEGRVPPRGMPAGAPQDAMGAILAATQRPDTPQAIPFSQATPMGPEPDEGTPQPPQQMAQAQAQKNPIITRDDIKTLPPFPPVAKVIDTGDRPPIPKPTPITEAERYATFRRNQSADPVIRQGWEGVMAEEQAKRQFNDKAIYDEYKNKLTNWEANQTFGREAQHKALANVTVAQQNEERARQAAFAAQMGNLPPEAVKEVTDSYLKIRKPAVETIAQGQTAIRRARLALSEGAITGVGAEARINWSRLMGLMGMADQGSDAANSQLFKTVMQPVINAQRVAAAGNTNISNADIANAEKAAAADYKFEPKTLAQMLNILEENSVEALKDYKAKSTVLFGTDRHPAIEAAFGAPKFEEDLQKLPAPLDGRPVQVFSVKDAMRYPKGTLIIDPKGNTRRVE